MRRHWEGGLFTRHGNTATIAENLNDLITAMQ
jgi:hypothetical protein